MDRRKIVGLSRGTSLKRGRVGHPVRGSILLRGNIGMGVQSNLRRGASGSSTNLQSKLTDARNYIPTSTKETGGLTYKEEYFKQIIPAFSHYFKTPPTLTNFATKVAATEDFLFKFTNLVQCASNFEIESSMNAVRNNSYYPVDVDIIKENATFCTAWPTFDDDLTCQPGEVINLWSATAHKVIVNALLVYDEDSDHSESGHPDDDVVVSYVRVGFLRSSQITPLAEINSCTIGHFITVTGVVVRTGSLQPYICSMTFRCKICGTNFDVTQASGNYTQPSRCISEECSNKVLFESMEGVSSTALLNSRMIRLQDTLYNDGGLPKTVDCLLLGNLVDQCCSSDVVTLTGIVRMQADLDYEGVQSTHNRYVEVSAVQLPNQVDRTMGGHILNFSDSDYASINKICTTPNLFRLLVASLCPTIFGQELVKAGLLLTMFGGRECNSFISKRGDINMLMIGDPGLGKSRMLKTVAEIAPRSIYICGNGSSNAGLTVTLTREGGDYSLNAGAIVLADKGIICIDEIDKMFNQHHVMLEAMEQQRVTITKAGVHRQLPARVSVFAAANPVGGHFDSTKTVFENTKISHPLLSRFDLIFVLVDKSDEELDRNVAQHILSIDVSKNPTSSSKLTTYEKSNHLRKRLQPCTKTTDDLISHDLMQKYVAYARQYVHPKLTSEAGDILKSYFLKIRRGNGTIHSIPPTARLLESLVRLTEARAKIELRESATVEDANDVLDLYKSSLDSPFDDEFKATSALAYSLKGSKKTGTKSVEKFLNCLQLYAKKENRRIFHISEMRNIGDAMGFGGNIDILIGKLNSAGELLMKGGEKYQLL